MSGLISYFHRVAKPGRERRRLLMTIFGVCCSGISVGFFKQANFGIDPFQTLCTGLHNVIPIDYGTLYVIINAVLLGLVFVLDRHYISLGTFVNLFLIGYVVDFSNHLIYAVMGDPSMALRIFYIILAMLILCISSAMYFTADMGVSTYDAIPLYLASKKIAPFRVIRICTDLICVGVGFAFGCMPGVGTILTALCMGPLVSFFNEKLAKPLLEGKNG